MIFEDSITREDDILLKAIRHPLDPETRQYIRKVENAVEEVLSKDSNIFEYLYGKGGASTRGGPAFHKEFPRKASSLDNDEIYIDMNNDFLLRWFPRHTLRMVFPAIYFQELIDQLKKERKSNKRPVLVEFTGGQVPTSSEKEECKARKGKGYWARNGTWFCTCQKIDFNTKHDTFGPLFFNAYGQWLLWHRHIMDLSEKAREEENTELLARIHKAKVSHIR